MNKENIDKLLSIIDLLDKITGSNELQNENKLKSFISSELSRAFDSLNDQSSIYPLNYKQDAENFCTNKIISEIKTTKSLFYMNKSNLGDVEFDIDDKDDSPIKDTSSVQSSLSIHGSEELHYLSDKQKKENSNELMLGKDVHNFAEFNKMNLDIKNRKVIVEEDALKKTNSNEKIDKIDSLMSDAFSFIKIGTDNILDKKKSTNVSRDYFSDTELMLYNNVNEKKKDIFKILRRKKLKKSNKIKLKLPSVESTTRINSPKKYKTISNKIELDEHLDHKIIGQLLEKIIEHLNVNLKEILSGYIKKINKLTKTNDNLSNKLETAVENNDEQAQEIRDLNKRIKLTEEQKLELNKIIEKYEFEIDNTKILENKMKSDEKQKNALGQEIKNLKKELNAMNILNNKIKEEKLLLQEEIKNKNEKIKEEKDKLKIANDIILEKDNLISKLQLDKNLDIPFVKLNKKEIKSKRHIISCKTKNRIIDRYQSDTILSNYDRIKNKLFESNERCYFLSKTNLELFKGLKKKKKKIDALSKQITYLKQAVLKGKEKLDQLYLPGLKIEENISKSSMDSDISTGNVIFSNLVKENDIQTEADNNNMCEFDNSGYLNKIENLDEQLNKKNNEHNLLKKKYEVLYKKYIKLLKIGSGSEQNQDFTFIEKRIEDIAPKNDVIHSFYLKKSEIILKNNVKKDNKLISYVKAKIVDKDVNTNKFRNYKEDNKYNDVEFYISNEILQRMDIKNILNIRYIYSHGNKKVSQEFCQNKSMCNYYKCKC